MVDAESCRTILFGVVQHGQAARKELQLKVSELSPGFNRISPCMSDAAPTISDLSKSCDTDGRSYHCAADVHQRKPVKRSLPRDPVGQVRRAVYASISCGVDQRTQAVLALSSGAVPSPPVAAVMHALLKCEQLPMSVYAPSGPRLHGGKSLTNLRNRVLELLRLRAPPGL